MNKKHQGAKAELLVCAWLLQQGYEVFRNVSQHGLADISVYHPGTKEQFLIDVKTARRWVKKDGTEVLGTIYLTREQTTHNVRTAYVNPETNICYWA